ncbi:MAG: PEP-CTERM sorting domain-containing protein [Phycisphaeraceae bacterium]|nr:MAG: PEP-CTERM sorting domain-containing protein [Phycisphaeraceae bacterium]
MRTAIAALIIAAGAAAAGTVSSEAISNATVNSSGVRSQDYFFNIEGANNGSFATYGAATFDGAALKGMLDGAFGAGMWQIDSVTLALVQNNAGFTNNGIVNVNYTNNDDLGLQTPGAAFPTYADANTVYSDAQLLTAYNFVQTATGDTDMIGLGAASQVAADIAAGDLVTLFLQEGDPDVAATWSGYTNGTYAGPTLIVDASRVPAPGALALVGLGGLVAGRRRR